MTAVVAQLFLGLMMAFYGGRRANDQKAGTHWFDRIAATIIGAAGAFAVLVAITPQSPVLVDATATVVSQRAGEIRIQIEARKPKDRAKCHWEGTEAFRIDELGRQAEAPFKVEDDAVDGNTRPPGRIEFEVWRVSTKPQECVNALLFRAHHRCDWWLPETVTDLGPFPISNCGRATPP